MYMYENKYVCMYVRMYNVCDQVHDSQTRSVCPVEFCTVDLNKFLFTSVQPTTSTFTQPYGNVRREAEQKEKSKKEVIDEEKL